MPGFTRATCSACHPETLKPDGSVDVAGGRHVNGQAEGFAGHPAGWLDVSSPAFHGPAALPNPSACLTCHAADSAGDGHARHLLEVSRQGRER